MCLFSAAFHLPRHTAPCARTSVRSRHAVLPSAVYCCANSCQSRHSTQRTSAHRYATHHVRIGVNDFGPELPPSRFTVSPRLLALGIRPLLPVSAGALYVSNPASRPRNALAWLAIARAVPLVVPLSPNGGASFLPLPITSSPCADIAHRPLPMCSALPPCRPCPYPSRLPSAPPRSVPLACRYPLCARCRSPPVSTLCPTLLQPLFIPHCIATRHLATQRIAPLLNATQRLYGIRRNASIMARSLVAGLVAFHVFGLSVLPAVSSQLLNVGYLCHGMPLSLGSPLRAGAGRMSFAISLSPVDCPAPFQILARVEVCEAGRIDFGILVESRCDATAPLDRFGRGRRFADGPCRLGIQLRRILPERDRSRSFPAQRRDTLQLLRIVTQRCRHLVPLVHLHEELGKLRICAHCLEVVAALRPVRVRLFPSRVERTDLFLRPLAGTDHLRLLLDRCCDLGIQLLLAGLLGAQARLELSDPGAKLVTLTAEVAHARRHGRNAFL